MAGREAVLLVRRQLSLALCPRAAHGRATEPKPACAWRRDFTNTSLQDWWVDNFFMGKNGAGSGNKWVDGCFSDVRLAFLTPLGAAFLGATSLCKGLGAASRV